MILADPSVWIQHFRLGLPEFEKALRASTIAMHPAVLGELATGNLSRRASTLVLLRQLPRVSAGTADECLSFIETHKLHGLGIGWNDVQLLVASRLSRTPLWSMDARLHAAAMQLGTAYVTA